MKILFPCTECKADAFVGYTAGWADQVKPGERLCSKCFRKRTGLAIYGGEGYKARIGRP